MTGASTSNGYIIDLTYLNHSEILHDYQVDGKTFTAITYEGGCVWKNVYDTTAGTGYTAVGARVSNVGVGGFSTGGGIGFLAGAYGYAVDRLRAMDVVLADGCSVTATAHNAYSDLFWALRGGGGQFGIVTKFYQEAAAEPSIGEIRSYIITNTSDQDAMARKNTVKWFGTNTDPFSLMYFVRGLLPADPSNLDPSTFALRTALITLRFQDPNNPRQPSYDQTFGSLVQGLSTTGTLQASVPLAYMYEEFDPYFPYGFRRGFYGPQVTNITAPYLTAATSTFDTYIGSIVQNGESPVSALWAVQYMYPGLNGNLPASNSDTAWPHAIAGHQTLFSPSWSKVQDDAATLVTNSILNDLTYAQQTANGPFIADYPNYISPGASGSRVWGSNVARLIAVKQKYDPQCRIHNGRTFASKGCLRCGWANIFI